MNEKEDLIISILEIYKRGEIFDREAVFKELKKSDISLEFGEFNKIMADLLDNEKALLHKGSETNCYVFNSYNDLLGRLKTRQSKRNKIKKRKDLAEYFRDLKDILWIFTFLLGLIIGLFTAEVKQSILSKLIHRTTKDTVISNKQLLRVDTFYINCDSVPKVKGNIPAKKF